MKKTTFLISFFLLMTPGLFAQQSNEKENLENLLHKFLEGASENDKAFHDRFWAGDLIYTSSNGERVTKQDIMESLENEDSSNSEDTVYHAEDIQISLYGDTAVIAFKLVANTETLVGTERMEFFNTGTFLKRNGEWRAVAWQATQIP